MKSLLVDALRAANDGSDGLKLEDTVEALNVAKPGVQFDVANDESGGAAQIEELELIEPLVTTEPQADFGSDLFESAQPVAAAPENDAHSAPTFERVSIWVPAACTILALLAAVFSSSWMVARSERTDTDLGILLVHNTAPPAAGNDRMNNALTPRFGLLTGGAKAPPEARDTAESAAIRDRAVAPANPISVQRHAATQRSPVGTTILAHDTFSSLAATYQSFLSGQITGAAMDKLLSVHSNITPDKAEDEIRLLLQRYPDSHRLHIALGNLLANSGRLPEANVAFARAAVLAGSTGAGDRR